MQLTDYFTETQEILDGDFTCELFEAAPGGGKTTIMLAEMAANPTSYVLAVPRIDLIAEHAARLREMAIVEGRALEIVEVHSRTPGAKGKVERRLRDTLDAITSSHAIVITTHTGLMSLAPGEVTGFHVRIDELPEAAIVSGRIGLAVMWHSMAALYTLVPGVEAGWYRLVPRPNVDPVGLRGILGGVGRELVELHRLAGSSGRVVEVNVSAWDDAGVPNAPPVQWRSIWTLATLGGAASLKMAAAGYEHSLARYALERVGGVRMRMIRVGKSRTGQPRIRIQYYTAKHAGSTAWWDTKDGSACLVAISRHLADTGFSGFWAGNGRVEPFFAHRFDGTQCKPKLAGTNSLRDHTSCALIYSAKTTPDDEAVIEALGLNPDAIRVAREDEDVFQFACRGAIRDPAFAGDYAITVYDLDQADRLRTRLLKGGYTNVCLTPIAEAGLLDVERPKPAKRGPKPVPTHLTADEQRQAKLNKDAERKRETRKAERNASIAAGTYRPRGRPKCST